MMALRTKLYSIAIPFAISSAALVGVSTTMDGGQDAYLVRLGLWISAFGILICLVTWAVHRAAVVEQRLTFAEARADAADRRADEADDRADELTSRLATVENELKCRRLLRRILDGKHVDEQLRYLFEPKDN